MKSLKYLLIVSMWLCLAGPSLQADDKWSWNPFSSDSKKAKTSSSESSWIPKMQMPSFLKSSKTKTARKKDSAWNKMTRSSKNMWNKTTSFLDPYPDNPQPAAAEAAPVKSASFWDKMWKKDEKKEYSDVNDWLRDGKRPN